MFSVKTKHQRHTVLVVDDEPAVLEVIALALREVGGYEVIEAGDGHRALTQLKSSKVDLVVTDLHMPNMDGLQLIRHLVDGPWSMPIIAMSGGSNKGDTLQEAQRLGAHAALLKPFSMPHLLDVIAELVQAKPEGL